MSHARSSAGVGARRRPEGDGDGCCACATATKPNNSAAASVAASARVHVRDETNRRQTVRNLAIATDPPRLNPVAVSELALNRRVKLLPGEAPVLRKFSLRRLNLALDVRAARLQDGFFALPLPRQHETGVCLGEYRSCQFGLLVCLAAVGGNLHLAHRA